MGVKGQKRSRMTKNSPYLRNHTSYDCYLCLYNDNICRCFFHFFFFLIFIFRVHRGAKWQKTVQNDKIFCLSRTLSQKPYIIWLSFTVQMHKMIISPGVFFSVKFFQVVKGLKGQKIAQNVKSFSFMYKRIISPGIFFIFF